MEFKHIAIENLALSAANMRGGRKSVDLTNILPSIRARGILLPLIVRPVEESDDRYEIVAGKRRFLAAEIVAQETGGIEPLPCAVMAAGDDAAALEVSLIENFARLSPSEVENWSSFVRLVKEGRTPEDISLTFGLTELQVKRTLALGNLLPRIRNLYRDERIDATTVRHLTLASKTQQREWLALLDDENAYAPTGQQLKAWLFGGASIGTSAALFDLASYPGEIVTDLFGEGGYFADASQFWAAQDEAIEARRAAYLDAGWSDVTILPHGEYFQNWEYERTPKRKGGKVFVAISQRGEVQFHEGYLTRKEAKRRANGECIEQPPKPARPEVTSTMRTYIDLHRHAAVRAKLADHPSVAFPLMVAHAIVGSPLWSVKPEPQRAGDAVAESVENSASEAAFDEKRRAVLALLGFDPDTPTVTGGNGDDYGVSGLFLRLLDLPDPAVMDVIAIVMGETLESGSAAVETVGIQLGVDMAPVWQADDVFLDMIRDKQVLTEIVREVAGEQVANANAKETGKVQRSIIRDCLTGDNGRAKVEGWVPRWMAFPPAAYTEREGVPTVIRASALAATDQQPEPLRQAA